jgi:hypothetical protein
MNCPNCNKENTDNAKFCVKCGALVKHSPELTYSNTIFSEKLIIIGLSINFLAFLVQLLFNNLSIKNNWSTEEWRNLAVFTSFLFLIGNILIPIALKDLKLKIIGIILVLTPHLYWIIQAI